jgi:hypothetical protein
MNQAEIELDFGGVSGQHNRGDSCGETIPEPNQGYRDANVRGGIHYVPISVDIIKSQDIPSHCKSLL